MFGPKKTELTKIETVIAEGTTICGELISSTGTMRIDGKVEGKKIEAKGLIIGEKGSVVSEISTNIAVISGYLKGNVIAKEKIEILSKAVVCGNLTAPNLSIAEGSKFEGNCLMNEKEGNISDFKDSKDEIN
jgi:cytoskeletal protein CcmA (bactofilin family)